MRLNGLGRIKCGMHRCSTVKVVWDKHIYQTLLERARTWRKADGRTEVRLTAEDILTPAEVAARLKVPESWVYEKTRTRCKTPLPCLKVGRYIRFNWQRVIEWLESQANGEPTRR